MSEAEYSISVRDRSDPEQWHPVPGKEDPADDASHSLTARQLLKNKRWLSGPEFRCTTALQEKHSSALF